MSAFDQEFRGNLLGRIIDTDTNAAVETKSNEQRNYRILLPGNYRIVSKHASFKKVERDGIRISVGSGTTLDLALKLGAATESVTITAAAPGEHLDLVIDNIFVRNLPVSLTRNAMNRAMMSAGVTGDTGTYTSNAQSNFSIQAAVAVRCGVRPFQRGSGEYYHTQRRERVPWTLSMILSAGPL